MPSKTCSRKCSKHIGLQYQSINMLTSNDNVFIQKGQTENQITDSFEKSETKGHINAMVQALKLGKGGEHV